MPLSGQTVYFSVLFMNVDFFFYTKLLVVNKKKKKTLHIFTFLKVRILSNHMQVTSGLMLFFKKFSLDNLVS